MPLATFPLYPLTDIVEPPVSAKSRREQVQQNDATVVRLFDHFAREAIIGGT